ncbi:hypothetical protein [Sphingomonas edaphi]|uniref:Uncharacterized protein n=1 Tax=Sphingomonas edaphi TaxID=2315689 RepID=A0A418Q388_9SPHN|nr:hypothetical protein [Sphingomonas edaphi]RIX32363.1 hypothetical protein D3M59_05290 [Sphingomonas edaphi]
MEWKLVRLELASNGEFPRGSAGRTYLLRLPLADDGHVDCTRLAAEPERAVVRRYWANEADRIGHLVGTSAGLAIRYEVNDNSNGPLFPFGADRLSLGGEVKLTDVDGRERDFRVASVT